RARSRRVGQICAGCAPASRVEARLSCGGRPIKKGRNMNDDAIFWGITIICLLISVPPSFSMNESLHKKLPDVKPFAWGYYIGLMGALSGTAVGILQFIAASNTYGSRSDTF